MDDKIVVSRVALTDLMLWCQDAIDFKDESDAWIVPAFDALREQLVHRSR
jgi:hypothetical protein